MKLSAFIILFLVPLAVFSQGLNLETGGYVSVYDFSELGYGISADLAFDWEWFFAQASASFTNESSYDPLSLPPGDVVILPGQIFAAVYAGPFTFELGRISAVSNLETPYSLFISSEGLTSEGANFVYDGDFFFFSTRWMLLNFNSDMAYPSGIDDSNPDNVLWRDRGANHKTWGIWIDDFRFGIQDAGVYLDRPLDPVYLLSPLPYALTQLIMSGAGDAWSDQNNNSLTGVFCEYLPEDGEWYAYGQLLADDLDLGFIPGLDGDNQTKLAWSTGISWDSPVGKFGFYHAGAMKYTFEAVFADSNSYSLGPSGYTYYPAVGIPYDGDTVELWYTDNYIGYKYGENNLAFNLTYGNIFFEKDPWAFSLEAGLEWIINGSKSPANPWHEYTDADQASSDAGLLTDPVLEHILELTAHIEKQINSFKLFLDIELGCVLNGIATEVIAADEPVRYVPQEDNNYFMSALSFGFLFDWGIL